jgi:hypothetical protein
MNLKVTVSPSSFTAELTVIIESDVTLNTVLRLTDSKEKVARIIGCTLAKGENKVQLKNLSKYAAGNYQLEVKLLNGELLETIRLHKAS